MNTLIRYLLQILIIIPCITNASVPKLPHCTDKNKNGLVLINTLDGKLSVLNYDTGQILWNMETGPGPMLSSNIDRLELTNNGHWVRIIPSLAGNLYKFNGDTIDPIPLTADNLLATSFQYSDDIVIVGGKEIRSYGVMLHSGKVLYDCSLSGCINKTKNTNYEDFILVERNTHIIRAVESRFGAEKWNFSVGQLNIKLQQLNCRTDSTHKINFNLKQVISEGLIYAFGDSEKILWKHQFDTPIVNMWTWDGHNIKSVNLFSNTHYSWGMMNINSNIAPALYVGMHQKQLYVQESELMQRFLSSNKQKNSGDITELNSVSQIPWKPFPASSSALSVIDPEKTISYETENNPTEISTTALSVLYASEYINGNGFYLYPNEPVDENCANNNTIETVEIEDLETPVQLIITSIWYFWKEILVIAITTAVVVNMFITHRFFKKYQPKEKYILVERHIPISTSNESDRKTSESSDKEFVSRYLTDFIPIQCLGKGGFGIVFEAKNKIDECNYAVKKITLPKKKESRDRVMREVKTLAKLDHQHIVRYYNAWLETPPPEWITDFEEEWKRDVISTDGLEYTSQLSSCPSPIKKQSSSVVINMINNNSSLPYNDSDLKLHNDADSDSFIVFASESDKVSSQSEEPKEIKQESISKDSVINDTTETFDILHNSKSSPTASFPESSTVFLYIQMQLCQKESLRDWLKKNVHRDVDFINFMFFQIVSAVEYVHANGLIHRDLKPSNIFFSINGDIKIGDFGLVTENEECVAVESGDECLDDCSCKENKHTQAVGTQLYMSPEQLKGLNYNFKVDIYSLGVIFFEMLVPFHTTMERNKTLLDLRQNKFPHDFCRSYKKEHQLVSRMLSQNPDARPTSMEIKTKLPSYSPDLE